MKLGAFVVTYHRPEELTSYLESLQRQTRAPDQILVVDNGNDPLTRGIVESVNGPAALSYAAMPSNLGSAGGTAFGTQTLFEEGIDLVLSGDDDNPPISSDVVERLENILVDAPSDVGGAGVLGARWNWRHGRLERLATEELEGVVEVDFIGGNHCLTLTRECIQEVGPPRSELFFGYPDLEHCLRIRQAGYRLLVDAELMYLYRERAGRLDLEIKRSVRPRRSSTSIWRNYYTTRNYVHMMRSFGRSDLANREAWRSLLRSAASWLRGPAYGASFSTLMARALLDGFRGKLGKTVEPERKRSLQH